MDQIVSLSPLGILLAAIFASAMGGLIWWMFRVPAEISATVAHARRSVDAIDTIMVPIIGTSYSQQGVEVACRLGQEQKARILLTYVIEVPRTLPLGAPLPQAEKAAGEALDTARQIV